MCPQLRVTLCAWTGVRASDLGCVPVPEGSTALSVRSVRPQEHTHKHTHTHTHSHPTTSSPQHRCSEQQPATFPYSNDIKCFHRMYAVGSCQLALHPQPLITITGAFRSREVHRETRQERSPQTHSWRVLGVFLTCSWRVFLTSCRSVLDELSECYWRVVGVSLTCSWRVFSMCSSRVQPPL